MDSAAGFRPGGPGSAALTYTLAMRRFLIAAIGLSAFVLVSDAQVRPIYDMGAVGLTQILQRLQTTASVLHTGAHPDDAASAPIASTARGDHARAAYVP